MKKKHPVLLGSLIIIVIVLGWKSLERPRQITFLKKHEDEMTAFIKKYSSEDEDITFHWDTVDASSDMAFSERVITIRFDIKNSSEPRFNNERYTLRIRANLIILNKIDELTLLNNIFQSQIKE